MTPRTDASFVATCDATPAYWMYDILCVPLAEGHQTGGSYSIIQQWTRGGSSAHVPHVHN